MGNILNNIAVTRRIATTIRFDSWRILELLKMSIIFLNFFCRCLFKLLPFVFHDEGKTPHSQRFRVAKKLQKPK